MIGNLRNSTFVNITDRFLPIYYYMEHEFGLESTFFIHNCFNFNVHQDVEVQSTNCWIS